MLQAVRERFGAAAADQYAATLRALRDGAVDPAATDGLQAINTAIPPGTS